MSSETESAPGGQPERKWRPLTARERRVLGVLMEKARTTPDAYPLSLNGLVTGCNQKSNRDPVNSYTPEQVEETLTRLRDYGAVAEVHTSGVSRVPKYKQYGYEWLGVDRAEFAIMTELLLRGEQTLGDLRAHVGRMEKIADLPTLKLVLQRLAAKGLVQFLTPEGRGQIVAHTLYLEKEIPEVHARAAARHGAALSEEAGSASPRAERATPPESLLAELRAEIDSLRADLEAIRAEVRMLRSEHNQGESPA